MARGAGTCEFSSEAGEHLYFGLGVLCKSDSGMLVTMQITIKLALYCLQGEHAHAQGQASSGQK